MSAVMDSDAVSRIEIREWTAPEAWMVGASTRLVDCWAPQTEWIRMPTLRWPAAVVEMRVGRGRLPASRPSPLRRLAKRLQQPIDLDDHTVAVDLRPLGGWNIAHAVIGGIVRFHAADLAARRLGSGGKTLAIVPGDVSPYVRAAYEIFGVPVLATDAEVVGRFIEGEIADHQAIALAPDLLPPAVAALLDQRSLEFPRKVFLARRGSREIPNMPEIQGILKGRGFTTVYPEKLSVLDQFRLLWHVDEVVGVHGAALALLLPRVLQQPRRPLCLVEVFGPGYIVSLYRCLAAGLGANWVGVRGRLMPEVVRDLDQLGQDNWRHRLANALRAWVPGRWLPPDKAWQRSHQMSNFEVDPQTMSLALEMVRDPDRALPERVWG